MEQVVAEVVAEEKEEWAELLQGKQFALWSQIKFSYPLLYKE
jgi:hypothetical protein